MSLDVEKYLSRSNAEAVRDLDGCDTVLVLPIGDVRNFEGFSSSIVPKMVYAGGRVLGVSRNWEGNIPDIFGDIGVHLEDGFYYPPQMLLSITHSEIVRYISSTDGIRSYMDSEYYEAIDGLRVGDRVVALDLDPYGDTPDTCKFFRGWGDLWVSSLQVTTGSVYSIEHITNRLFTINNGSNTMIYPPQLFYPIDAYKDYACLLYTSPSPRDA